METLAAEPIFRWQPESLNDKWNIVAAPSASNEATRRLAKSRRVKCLAYFNGTSAPGA